MTQRSQIASGVLRFPMVTVFVIIVAVACFIAGLNSPSNMISYLPLCPFIHLNLVHILGNLVGIVIMGSIVELWVCPTSQGERILLFLLAYGISVGLSTVRFLQAGLPSVGLSDMLYVLLGFAVCYQLEFSRRLHRPSRLALAGIGVIVLITFYSLVFDLFVGGLMFMIAAEDSHLASFVLGPFTYYAIRSLLVDSP